MPNEPPLTDDRSDTGPSHDAARRRLLAMFGGAGVTLLAGCASSAGLGSPTGSAGDDGHDGSSDGGDGNAASDTGTFRLLISDQPVAIDEFDSLEVSFDRARVFQSGGEGADAETAAATASPAANPTSTATDAPTATETSTPASTETATEAESPEPTVTETAGPTEVAADEDGVDDDGDEDGGRAGFTVIDLDGATVDLTLVIGELAQEVFDGSLPTGRYTKIELYASEVVGSVDGESADVSIPSGKLMLTKPFEISADGGLDFVFDITVVRKGPNGYNLLPVIGESGVAGEDVAVEELEPGSKPAPAAGDGAAEDEDEGTADDPAKTEAPDGDGGSGQGGTGSDGDQGNGPPEDG